MSYVSITAVDSYRVLNGFDHIKYMSLSSKLVGHTRRLLIKYIIIWKAP